MADTGSFGWAYIGKGLGGPNGAIQYRDDNGLAGSSKFTYDKSTDSVLISGSLEVSGAITANQFNVNIVNRTVSSIDVTGSTHFGDTSDDKHVFTGSLIAVGPLTASQYVSASTFYGLGTNLTAIDAGNIAQGTLGNARLEQIIDRQIFSGSVAISGAVGRFGYLTGTIDASNLVGTIDNARLPSIIDVSYVTASTAITSPDAKFTSISGTIVQASQPQITSLGTLENLSITGDLNVDSPTLKVDSAGGKVGIGAATPVRTLEVVKTNEPQLRVSYRQQAGLDSSIHSDFETRSDGSLKISNTGQKLVFTGSTSFSGNLDVTDTITAQIVDVYQLRVTGTLSCFTGSTRFGDLSTDTHTYTGSVHYAGPVQLNSNLTASGHVSASLYYGDGSTLSGLPVQTYSDAGDNRLLTSVNSNSIQGEELLTFDGSILNVVGTVSGSKLTDGTGSFEGGAISGLSSLAATTVTATNLGGEITTAAQPNITSLGTLSSLAISGDLTVDTPVLKVDSSNHRVGVGLTNPLKTFEILNDSDTQVRLSYQRSTGLPGSNNIYSDFQTLSDGTLKVSTYNDTVWLNAETKITGNLEVSGSGKFIGDLEITGTLSAKLTNFQVSADSLVFGDNSADSLVFSASSVQTPNGLNFNSNTLYIDQTNSRIGIGTNSPQQKLHVEGSIYLGPNDTKNYIHSGFHLGIQADGDISIVADVNDTGGVGASDVVFGYGSSTNTDSNQDFTTGELGTYPRVETMRIKSSNGYVGIGTDSPTQKLHVDGIVRVTENITASIFTNETITISGSGITGVGSFSAANLGGTLTTAAQPNITSLGTLTSLTVAGALNLSTLAVDTDTLFVSASNDRVGVGTLTPRRTLDVKNEDGYQLRLTNQQTSFPMNEVYTDFSVNDAGNLLIAPYGGDAFLSGNLEVSGTVYANELVTNIVNKNVVEISATGSTKFGDTTDDLHQFTGSLDVSGAAYVNDLYVAGVAYGGSPFKVSGGLNVLEGDVNVTSGQISAGNVNMSNLNITGSGTNLISGSIQISGSILPNGNEMHDLGAPGVHWRNIYCGDFHLKNDRGSWTIVEEEDYLSLRNNKTGKLFKFVLQEIT